MLKDKLEGIGWFSYQSLKRITRQNKEVHFVFLFDRMYDEEFIFSDNITPLVLSPQARHPFLYYLYFQHSVKGILHRLKPDLFLSPDGFLSLGANCKQLPVIHDINFLHHPADSKWLTGKYYNYYFPKFAAAATRIATVSEFSKNDIAKSYDISRDKIDVVYNGINEDFRVLTSEEIASTRKKYSQEKEYFLHVGAMHPRKNIPVLIDAFTAFKAATGSAKKLVLAGPEFWGMESIAQALKKSNFVNDIIFTGRLNAAELALVVGSASALCLVSYYEGFGIPLVEAMAAGTPIICSDASCLPEIAGDAALYVDPFSVQSITEKMIQIENDKLQNNRLIELGLARATNYSWDITANLLWKSIEKTQL